MNPNLTFGEALDGCRRGYKVARRGWNGKGMFLFYVTHWTGALNGMMFPTLPFIAMKTADNKIVPWLASQTDILATDWEVVP